MSDLSAASYLAYYLSACEASSMKSAYIDTEHLWIGLCKVEDIIDAKIDLPPELRGIDQEKAMKEIKEFKSLLEACGLDCKRARRKMRELLYKDKISDEAFTGHRTERCKDVYQQAAKKSLDMGFREINLIHLFLAVIEQPSRLLDIVLSEFSVSLDSLFQDKTAAAAVKPQSSDGKASAHQEPMDQGINQMSKTPFLDKYGRNLTALAKSNQLDPVIGRADMIKKTAQILVQKKKNNPILVGEPGVGKTTVVEGLAQRAAEENAHASIRNFRIYEINIASLIAGTRLRGELEEKISTLLKEAASDPNIVLFIDEIHTMVGAGASDSGPDISNMMKQALASGSIKCIGATTIAEYRKYIEKDPALERRFQLVWVDEPSRDETVQILSGLKAKYEDYHGIRIPDALIGKAVDLSIRYLHDFRLPDKAIDLIDQACAKKILKTLSPIKTEDGWIVGELTLEDIYQVISQRTHIPADRLCEEGGARYMDMEKELGRRVIGQENAVKAVSEVIRMAKAGLKDPDKPIGVFLFLGSTGTGKTELAKALTEFLFHDESKLITIDMSEYQEKHSIAKLIGAPPGYVGYDQDGVLTGKVRTNPYCVLLFDEIEKAHPDIFDIFLQIFDEGRLTDAKGRRVSFTETVIILTSNLGSMNTVHKKRTIGFASAEQTAESKDEKQGFRCEAKEYEENILRAVAASMRPEIINRITRKIIFYPLGRDTVTAIVKKFTDQLCKRLKEKDIGLVLTEEAVSYIVDRGYSEVYGAREMKRVFDSLVTEPVSVKIIEGSVHPGDILKVAVSGENLEIGS